MSNYNGWKNRQTWNLSLWINNDEGLYRQAMARWSAADTEDRDEDRAAGLALYLFPSGRTPDNDPINDDTDWPAIVGMLNELIAD